MNAFPGMQDVWGQLPRMKGYTHLAACFSQPETSRETIAAHLQAATHKITSALPWLGGAVINPNTSQKCTGNFTVIRCPQTENILKIQDRSEDCPSFNEILHDKASSDQLDGNLLSAETAMPDAYTETEANPAPVLTLTASWIQGGVVLDCAAQHNILDMGGIDQFFQLLATALQDREFSELVIAANTQNRLSMFPLLGAGEKRYDHSKMRCQSSFTPTSLPKPPPGPKPGFHYFRFSASNLTQLTVLAETPSTDDALSAFIWKRLSAIRYRHQNPNSITGFSRAVDLRRTLNVPTEYMGVTVMKTSSRMTFNEIEQSSLADIAAQLRQDVRRVRDQYFLRSLATLIAEEPDKSTISFVDGFNPDTWINASSWAGAATHRLDYGLLGKPAFVRRPKAKPVQGLLFFLPMMDDGDVDVLLCLNNWEIRGLCEDLEWCQYATYIG